MISFSTVLLLTEAMRWWILLRYQKPSFFRDTRGSSNSVCLLWFS